ncbi:MAG TPA: methionyl-tRNA formyltransferase [Candidatus Cloacimonadota bacterium]|nr:methionyl-tRNA formyltransferase [Candidatus Cloacimonadota bacterium]HOQ79431.1 methionyl-tRNA formyltransferase [Candidatus Cloacimonadota bacterium]HPK40140.1 methionyl-tRNA formyltransferase [Candidatus Cloacimonadota bacterium]
MIKKIGFVGTPQFAVPSLLALIKSQYQPTIIITQPDKPKGRKLVLTAPPVKNIGMEYGIEVLQPEDINSDEMIELLKSLDLDIIVTISYGGYIGREIRKMPKFGVINIHPSLLPLYRGSTPIQAALLHGDQTTGIAIFKLNAQMDAGAILYQKRYEIAEEWNFTQLDDILAEHAGEDLIKFLNLIDKMKTLEDYNAIQIRQDHDKATLTTKVSRETFQIDWQQTCKNIHNFVRAYSEVPAAYSILNDKEIKIIRTQMSENKSTLPIGTITDIVKNSHFSVATTDYDLHILEVKNPGKPVMSAASFINGARLKIGDSFGN